VTTFVTADLHFDHEAVIGYCKRPWANAEEMGAALVKIWNATVAKGDLVYVVGDVCLGKDPGRWIDQLEGELHLIKGNHDGKKTVKHPRWRSIDSLAVHKPTRAVLCHYPLEIWPGHHHGAAHLHGHSHGSMPSRGRRIDVGVDCWNYRPIEIEIAVAEASERPIWSPDHHQPKEQP